LLGKIVFQVQLILAYEIYFLGREAVGANRIAFDLIPGKLIRRFDFPDLLDFHFMFSGAFASRLTSFHPALVVFKAYLIRDFSSD
jgi:hypothetical protein